MTGPGPEWRQPMVAARARSVAYAERWRQAGVVTWLNRCFAQEANAERAAGTLLRDLGWLNRLLGGPLAQLADDPWFEAPLRCSRDRARTGAVVYDGPVAQISASVLAARGDGQGASATPAPATLIATGRLVMTRYVHAGGARLTRWSVGAPDDPFVAANAAPARAMPSVPLCDGQVLRHDGRVEAHRLSGQSSDIVMVSILLRHESVAVAREYAVDDGRLLRAAWLDDRPVRSAMLLRLLREMGRADAAPAMEAASRDPAFFLRWEAMREWLAMDAGAAMPRLAEMAEQDPHPQVREAAVAMLRVVHARLASAHGEGVTAPCPA